MKTRHSLIFLLLILSGCTRINSIGTQFKIMEEPDSGERARVRVTANMLVRGSPNTACMDWNSDKSGTILGGILSNKGYRGRNLDIPDPNHGKTADDAEFYVRADEPFTLMFTSLPESRNICRAGTTFVPEKGHDYEFVLLTHKEGNIHARCAIQANDVTNGQSLPVAVSETRSCY